MGFLSIVFLSLVRISCVCALPVRGLSVSLISPHLSVSHSLEKHLPKGLVLLIIKHS